MRCHAAASWWRRLRARPAVIIAVAILVPLYLAAAFAGFLAPYHYANQNRPLGWFRPMLTEVRVVHEGHLERPFVPGVRMATDRLGREVAESHPGVRHRLRWLVAGDEYFLFGAVGPFRTHLFGLDPIPIGAEAFDHAARERRLPAAMRLRRASLREIAAEIARNTQVPVILDPHESFGRYVRDLVGPLDVDLGGKVLGDALDAVVRAHRAVDEGSRLAWRLDPGGLLFTTRDRALQPRLYLLGSDQLGRDLLSRILWGAQVSLTVGLLGTAITGILGLLLGGIAGYVGGLTDFVLMRLSDLLMALPAIYLLLALRGMFPSGMGAGAAYVLIVLILSLVSWSGFCRLTRGVVTSLQSQDFVIAARALGASHWRCLVRHVLPNTIPATLVHATLTMPHYILGEVALSYLGLGVGEPEASWGNLLGAAQSVAALEQHPWVLIPGGFIFLAVLAYNLLGDALREAADPHAHPHGMLRP
ncbi:MAG: ABC transporter permease [Planctomycetota bacterium]